MIKAAIQIPSHITLHMTQDELKDYVLSSLAKYITQEVSKKMTIDKVYDAITDTTTYTGTLSGVTSNVNTVTVSGFNGTSMVGASTISAHPNNYSQINLRVVEYTKNGKVTRVELQKYDESSNDWFKIPRLQIEE